MKIRENIYSVGVVDSEVRMVHGYETPIGTTYNAYLIIDEKITLVDFVKAKFSEEFLHNIKAVLGDRSPDYIICNHAEPDHTGALPATVAAYPEAVVYGTAACKKELAAYYPESSYKFVTARVGDTLSTGKYTFEFIPMPMVHWPDSMSTYLKEEKLLFSNDALGQHIGTGEVTDNDLTLEKLLDRAGDYYANIIMPFCGPVGKLLDSIANLDIGMVCPAHGVILIRYINEMVAKYRDWRGGYADEGRAVVIYDTMWGTTEKLANRIAAEYAGRGISAEVISLSERHYSFAMARLLEAKYVAVGSPTLNNNVLPMVSAFLTYMRGLKPKNKIAKAFGSYGWSGESISQIGHALESCGFKMEDPLSVMWNV